MAVAAAQPEKVATPSDHASTKPWRPRPTAALLVRLAVVALPVVVAIVAAGAAGRAVPRPAGAALVLWLGFLLFVSGLVVVLVERFARRLLPLATLLELTLVFPDRTPSRFAVALRAGMIGRPAHRLQRMVDARHAQPIEAVLALVLSLGAHDRKTRGHSERVRAYAEVIADELRLGSEERNRLRWSALLHDIGKLAVHPHVLQKATALDEAEWDEIRRHPEEGARLVSVLVPWLGDWSAVVAQHHERWDGTGYPAGLTGMEISLGGRIVAVADAFEVMTAGRSYAGAITSPSAREELLRCAGSQFDPQVVRAFLSAGIAPVGWIARLPAWIGGLAVAGNRPSRDLATRGTAAVAAGLAALVLAAPVSGRTVVPGEEAAEVAGVQLENEEPAAATEADAAGGVAAAEAPVEPQPAIVETPPAPAVLPDVSRTVAPEVPAPSPPSPIVDGAPAVEAPAVEAPPTPAPAVEAPPAPAPAVDPEPAPAPSVPATPSGFARDDAITTTERPVRIAPLANDGGDGVALDIESFEVLDPFDHRNGRNAADDDLTYVPEPRFVGVDSMTYRVCTTTGVCETATVWVTVTER